jgi:hypothetical protein
VAIDVTRILSEHLAGNLGPDPADPDRRRRPDYGVTATLAGHLLEVVLTFRRGCAYCRHEWGATWTSRRASGGAGCGSGWRRPR